MSQGISTPNVTLTEVTGHPSISFSSNSAATANPETLENLSISITKSAPFIGEELPSKAHQLRMHSSHELAAVSQKYTVQA